MDTDMKNIQLLFPPGTKIIHFNGSPEKYTALLRSKCRTKEEFRQHWLKQYEKISKVAMRVLLTRPKTGKKVVYKAAFRCQHNTYPASHKRVKAPHRKHTGCPAILKVTIKSSPESRRVRSVDTLRKEYPTIITINHDHNHKLPNQGLHSFVTKEKLEGNPSETSNEGEADRNCWVESDLKIEDKLQVELDWDILKKCWNSFLDKWESSHSLHLYNALLKATNFLENCTTVNATIAALNSIGKKSVKKKYEPKVLLPTGSVSNTKIHNNRICKKSLPIKLEVSDPVDELLVIDQGWIL